MGSCLSSGSSNARYGEYETRNIGRAVVAMSEGKVDLEQLLKLWQSSNSHRNEALRMIPGRVAACPHEARKKDKHDDYPIHTLCDHHPTMEANNTDLINAINALVGAFPEALLIESGMASLPLHMASSYLPAEVASRVLQHNTEAASKQRRYGGLALHWTAMRYVERAEAGQLSFLIEQLWAYPLGSTTNDYEERTALRRACCVDLEDVRVDGDSANTMMGANVLLERCYVVAVIMLLFAQYAATSEDDDVEKTGASGAVNSTANDVAGDAASDEGDGNDNIDSESDSDSKEKTPSAPNNDETRQQPQQTKKEKLAKILATLLEAAKEDTLSCVQVPGILFALAQHYSSCQVPEFIVQMITSRHQCQFLQCEGRSGKFPVQCIAPCGAWHDIDGEDLTWVFRRQHETMLFTMLRGFPWEFAPPLSNVNSNSILTDKMPPGKDGCDDESQAEEVELEELSHNIDGA